MWTLLYYIDPSSKVILVVKDVRRGVKLFVGLHKMDING